MNIMTEEDEFSNVDSQRSMWVRQSEESRERVKSSRENAKIICDKFYIVYKPYKYLQIF